MSANNNHNYALIIAGGAGTRLWPLSRQNRPKQFQKFNGERTLLQHMVDLTAQVLPLQRIFVMATPEFGKVIQEQIPEIPAENLLAEPARRDNGPAAVYGMLQIKKRDPKAIVIMLWSDHLIQEAENFAQVLEASFAAANKYPQSLITIGANPSLPDPSLGYIRMGKEIGNFAEIPVYSVKGFVEKPDAATAKRFVQSWEYLWNTGYKVMGVTPFLDAFRRVQPELTPLLDSLEKAETEKEVNQVYLQFPKLSIEYLFTAHLKDILVIPADIGWSDIGSWNTLHDILKHTDSKRVVTRGEVFQMDCQECLVFAKDRPIAVLGLEDIIIVDEGDCLLVMRKQASQSIKELVSKLEKHKKELL